MKHLGTLILAFFVSCSRAPGTAPNDAAAPPVTSFDATALLRAEDTRQSKGIPADVRTHHDPAVRRQSARAFARIADAASVDALAVHLSDEDAETVAWAAYGLGYACKGREDAHVRLLAARSASVPDARGSLLEPRIAIARAIGRCAAPASEQVLVSLLQGRGPFLEAALLGLGDLATKRKQLGADTFTALLDAAEGRTTPQDLAFYALGRADPGEAFARRVADAARLALGRPGDARIFAIRALGRAGRDTAKETAPELARVVVDAKGFTPGERAEAARALGGLGTDGQAAIAGAVAELTPDARDPMAIAELAGAPFHVLYTLLNALGPEAPRKAESALSVLAALAPPAQPRPGFARRLAELRCAAALGLARGAYDSEILVRCDAAGSEASERVRLASLLRRPLVRERLAAFRALARSAHLRTREAAVEAISAHPELAEAGATILAEALTSSHAGLVATAAETLNAHPERAMVLAEIEKRAALDPRSPPPSTTPAQEVSPVIARALTAALGARWPEDRFETRIALIEAAATLRHPAAAGSAGVACNDTNPTVRERAAKALRTLGAPLTPCGAPSRELRPAAEIGATLAAPTRVVLVTEAGELGILLEPELSPITATRIETLVKSGFYKGIVIHRVVPGFVVQLGDPDGDGFGGSGTSLRCETAPVPFAPLDVGMALAGRDTGSSQFFVTLSRTPHLDGEYTRIGKADGDWSSIAQGDVVVDARIDGPRKDASAR